MSNFLVLFMQPIWAEGGGEHSVEVYSESTSNNAKSSPSYPQRVSLSFLTNQNSSQELKTSSNSHSGSHNYSSSDDNLPSSSFLESDSEAETEVSIQTRTKILIFLCRFISNIYNISSLLFCHLGKEQRDGII